MMKTIHSIHLLLIMIGLSCFCGCSESKCPKDFPETVPFTITVLRDGVPLADANVQLIADQGSIAATGGKTNANGVVSLNTIRGTFIRPGSPVGTFKVIVDKTPLLHVESSSNQTMNPEEEAAYYKKLTQQLEKSQPEVAAKFTSPDTTPLSVTVNSGGSAKIQVTSR